ncbi:hypothetical protein L596_017941 [Steinernema carpocapsae]|uniref:RNA methyltransferase n=1 Tax=Steinernema carpocapsae TaxID=34508 RepID=A0A4U5N357_STECR|nr:hypothetical protein L596_017941 [Steinernema carpocapsae]
MVLRKIFCLNLSKTFSSLAMGKIYASKEEEEAAKREKKKTRFRYGNYNRYYGTRLGKATKGNDQDDPRLEMLPKHYFEHKSVLDIGCNVGYLTMKIAKRYGPRRVVGIDIDDILIGLARKHIRNFCPKDVKIDEKTRYPESFFDGNYEPGNLDIKFPDNVWFRVENYVLPDDYLLDAVTPEFDVIMALSITKWIHLNWGDAGLKRFFDRAFRHLRPNGVFIVEPQDFKTYGKKSNLTPEIKENYKNIELKPDGFREHLEGLGFVYVEAKEPPKKTVTKGYDRPILFFKKPFNLKNDT